MTVGIILNSIVASYLVRILESRFVLKGTPLPSGMHRQVPARRRFGSIFINVEKYHAILRPRSVFVDVCGIVYAK